MGIQINGQTDTISAADGGVIVSGYELSGPSNINVTGVVTATTFSGALSGTATTATNLADAANITTGTINSARLSGNYNINVTGNVNSSGVSTFSQLQVGTGGTVITTTAGGLVGIGTTNPKGSVHIVNSSYKSLILSHTNTDGTATGAAIAGERKTKSNNPFAAFGSWDDGSLRKAYVGGGGWNLPEATEIGLFTATTYNETNNAAIERLKIDSEGRMTLPYQPAFMVRQSTGSSGFTGGQIANWDVVILNRGSHFKTTAGTGQNQRFIAPVAGVYHFNVMILSNENIRLFFQIRVNGSVVDGISVETYAGTNFQTATSTMTYQLSASDWVEVFVALNNAYGGAYANFNGFLLG